MVRSSFFLVMVMFLASVEAGAATGITEGADAGSTDGAATGVATASTTVAGLDTTEPRFTWGFVERIRQAYIRNGFDLENDSDDDWNYLRVRSQLWASYRPAEGVELYAKLNNEHRHWFKPDRDFDIDELIFENLYLRLDRIGGSPVSVIAGRQNVMLGEGFVFMDGGPLDGSRTAYFNAFRMIAEKGERSFELHVISDPHRDEYLPRVNSKRKPLIEWDETGAGIRVTDGSRPRLKLEAYYEFKREKEERDLVPETKLHTFGARLTGSPAERLTAACELAVQMGKRGGRDRNGIGGYLHAEYALPGRFDPALSAGIIHLSGDDFRSGTYGGWDPLYSRWPKWSELYIYTLVNEEGVAYWTNMTAPHAGLSAKPHEKVTLEATGYLLFAPEKAPQVYDGDGERWVYRSPFDGGNTRGTLLTVWLKWKLNRYLSGHLLYERFDPGSYYRDGADTAHFLRWELLITY